jgi:hypothetical protein
MMGDMEILGRAPAPYPNNDQGPKESNRNIPESFSEFYLCFGEFRRANKSALAPVKDALACCQTV